MVCLCQHVVGSFTSRPQKQAHCINENINVLMYSEEFNRAWWSKHWARHFFIDQWRWEVKLRSKCWIVRIIILTKGIKWFRCLPSSVPSSLSHLQVMVGWTPLKLTSLTPISSFPVLTYHCPPSVLPTCYAILKCSWWGLALPSVFSVGFADLFSDS